MAASATPSASTVLMAVSLLKDRQGVIDVNLPIGGSLDDPKFSVAGIVLRVIINIIAKAVTAPFALLASIAGSGEELRYVEFAAGSAVLAAGPKDKLEKLVPGEFKQDANHWLILHGRYTCKARKPDCPHCPIRDLCKFPGKTPGPWAFGGHAP